MLALGIRYLSGVVTATEPDSRERVEWPPHPGRVFMALAAAHFQMGDDPEERVALTWLETLSAAPAIRAGAHAERVPVTQFVPVNDKTIWRKDPAKPNQKPPPPLQSAPGIMRERQPRTFGRAYLEDDTCYFVWRAAQPPDSVQRALETLCGKVSRIGHSSSLVQMWVATEEEAGEPNWLPNEEGAVVHLRVPTPGTLLELERRYNRAAVDDFTSLQIATNDDSNRKLQATAKKRLRAEFPEGAPKQLRPELSIYQGYAPANLTRDERAAPGTVFGPRSVILIFEREDGPYRQLDLLCVLAVAQRLREAILSRSDDLPNRIRELLSGHDRDGAPLEGPHLAFLPLAFVSHAQADGHLLAVGFALPRDLASDDRRLALRGIARVQNLVLGRLGSWRLTPELSGRPPWNLRPETWTAHSEGATHWSTVTPVVFDRHPKTDDRAAYQREVAAMIATACTRIGLPEPREVVVTPVSAHLGVPPSHAFPRLQRKDGSRRRHSHAILVFEEPVCGPVLIGAGRYRGYGFFRPMVVSDLGAA